MQVYVNGQDHVFTDEKVNIRDVLHTYKITMPEMIALQINGREVEQTSFDSTFLSDGDEVDYIYRNEHCFFCLD